MARPALPPPLLTGRDPQALVIDAVEGVVAAAEQKSFDDYTDSAVCPVCYFTTASPVPSPRWNRESLTSTRRRYR